ncbi:MAG: flagellar basal body rod protein FlgC [Phycisphaerales bacterium]|nr:flagellar basal body rod protein FlgC [Phycisphaerales bacterium]
MIGSLDISGSALIAQRARMDVIAGNMANASSTHQEDGAPEPYRRRFVVFEPGAAGTGIGVRVADVREDESDFELRHDPSHPDALREGPLKGYVRYPNVSMTMEYVDALEAARAYEANLSMMNLSRGMIQSALRLFA